MAGLDLGVFPMGDWLISITLSKYNNPSTPLLLSELIFDPNHDALLQNL